MSVKLSYFDGRGLAEPIRIILSYGGVEFEDIRAPINKFPPPLPDEIKQKCTWGQVPLVEFEGKKLCQSLAITRYFANKFGLTGSDLFESALCDEMVDTIKEFMNLFGPLIMMTDGEEKKKKLEEVKKTADEKYLSKLNSIVEKNGGRQLVGKKLTWADIYLAHAINNAELINGIDLLKSYPALKSLSEAVFSEPKIKEWMDKRPNSKF